jgi:hypothetical protein
MDNINTVPASLPPPLAGMVPRPVPVPALGELPEDRQPISGVPTTIEAVLRQPRRIFFHLRQPGSARLVAWMLLVATLCSLIYGFVAGTFSMGTQLWAAPVKIAGGLLCSGLICLPSLYIFSCLSGSQARLGETFGLLAGLLMLMTVLLIGFAPVAWLFSQSTQSVSWMGALHLLFWFVAACFGFRFLHTGFAHSQARSPAGLSVWIIIFTLVMLQMTAALRPLIGTSSTLLPTEKKFFLAHWSDCLNSRTPVANTGPGAAKQPVN